MRAVRDEPDRAQPGGAGDQPAASGSQLLWTVDIYGFVLAGRFGRRRLLLLLLLIGAAGFAGASVLAVFRHKRGGC